MLLGLLWIDAAVAQSVDPIENARIEAVRITVVNPGPDAQRNARVEDAVRRALGVFPSSTFVPASFELVLAKARRTPNVASLDYETSFGSTGGVVLTVSVTLGEVGAVATPRGMLAPGGKAADFPVLYDSNGTYIKLKAEALGIHYGNADAWYGRPDVMLAGNPLVDGKPSGKGYKQWVEGFVQAGIYGITPVTDTFHLYGGVSVLASASAGRELFTDRTRAHVAVEDAYAGFVTGTTTGKGNRIVFNASIGRQRYKIGDGFLIINTSANGGDRAALQSNPRWAVDMLALAQLRYNNMQLEVFHLDPDELPVVDSRTKINGVNFDARVAPGLDIGLTYLHVPKSTFGYYTPTQSFTREGLSVYDARFRWQPNPAGLAGPFFSGEYGIQRNSNFRMRASAMAAEAGYAFAKAPWSPTISYRYARFTGDDIDTPTFERWDPLLSGGNGEQWVQGINHFKIFQNSNMIAHRFQLRARPSPKLELVPQFWIFRADSLTNLGGNPALSFLPSRDLGTEVNLTGKVFVSRNIYVQGHVAVTFPGDGAKAAIAGPQHSWLSTMLFVRVAY
ncbi:alginate export family protein [Sphingomonas sp. C3-2]|uniref:alginate export family protein n=1 Tax=Sphingomonas sp. C3-2 TaxID=3062169 RepID=UPI00294B30B0|nr:alginate export family protein [Sphingomonas sp. C3-2]WOK37520.1 alginate export family protein [Sphingomonas sp. C3-2]